MASKSGNTAKQLPETEVPTEPSMEEILSSIKQIIADDEVPTDGKSERERYTYPEGHSNSNKASDKTDSLELDMEAALQAELEGAMAAEDTSTSAGGALKEAISVSEKAAQVRAELSSTGAGLTADERIAQYRSQGKLEIEALAAAKAAKTAVKPVTAPVAPKVLSTATTLPPIPMLPSSNAIVEQMASLIMSEKSEEIQTILADLMRPTIRKWLGDNLPTMVEKLVREEIQAASRGRKASS